MRFQTDNPSRAVLSLLKDFPIGADKAFRGELARLKENRSFRQHFRKNGVTLDDFGELLLDRGIVAERPTPDDILCFFEECFRPTGRRSRRKASNREHRSADAALQHAVDVRRTSRLRLYECECGKKIRVADDYLVASHHHVDPDTGAESSAPFVLKTPILATSQTAPF